MRKSGIYDKNGFVKETVSSSDYKKAKETIRDTGYRKAAEFLMILGKDDAARVLSHLTEKEVKGITEEIALIKTLDSKKAKKVLEEFGYLAATKNLIARGGLEKAKEILIKAFGEEKGNELYKKIEMKTVPHPFSFLMDLEVEQVLTLLKDESAFVIAVILPHLDPGYASRILSELPLNLQKEVASRISRMGKIDPEVLRRTENALKKKILAQGEVVTYEIDGMNSLAEILKHMKSMEGKKLLSDIQDRDPELATEIEKRIFTIDIVKDMYDKELQKILRDYSDKELALIIKGVENSVKEKILNNISSRRKELILEESRIIGPVRKSEYNRAVDEFLDYIKMQNARGAVNIPQDGDQLIQ